MNALIMIAGVVFPLAAVGVAVWAGVRRMKKTGSGKKAFIRHLVVLGAMLVMCLGFSMMASAAAGDPAPAPEEASAAQPHMGQWTRSPSETGCPLSGSK